MTARMKKQKGQSLVIYVLMLSAVFGTMSLGLDLGRAYLLRARMQHAADAAALAAARELPYASPANAQALSYTALFGFVNGQNDVAVSAYPHATKSSWYVVQITKPARHLFAPLLGMNSSNVSVQAIAEYNSFLPINIAGTGEYGAVGKMTMSVFGPSGRYTYGDPFSAKYLDNGQLNPEYKANGYDFLVDVPGNYYSVNGTNMIRFEVFDPDTVNKGAVTSSCPTLDDACYGVRIDELRAHPTGVPAPTNRINTTVFSLYAPDSTPNNFEDDILVAQAVYGPSSTTTDMKWVTPSGFEFNLSAHGTGKYRINAKSTDGSSENGFNLRAGPPVTTFNPNNGTSIFGVGALPINFNTSGTITVSLGYVSAEAAGRRMHVKKFDTDVGAKSITYRCSSISGQTWSGKLSNNGDWQDDAIDIPTGYTGGTWTAYYVAGLQDTSVWSMWFEGVSLANPGFVRLVK